MADNAFEAARIPARHGAQRDLARRTTAGLRRLLRADPEPSDAEWRRIGRALDRGDPLADALVAWMAETGMKQARDLFERVLELGLPAVPAAPAPLRAFFESIERRPAWLDDALLARGAQACQIAGVSGLDVMRDVSLMGGYQAAGPAKVLVRTGALERGAGKRLAETSTWWMACTADGGMARFGGGFKQTARVRIVHAMMRRHIARQPAWDRNQEGLPVNQADMAATQLGFSALFVLCLRLYGIFLSRRDGHAVMHLTRYIGWLMGIEEQFLPADETAGLVLLYQLGLSMTDPSEQGRSLARSLMDEPLNRPHRVLPALRRRYERERHLSVSRYFLGAAAMRTLGLPGTLPWYPLLKLPLNALRFLAGSRSDAARRRMAAAGRRRQQADIDSLAGRVEHEIGGAVSHITGGMEGRAGSP